MGGEETGELGQSVRRRGDEARATQKRNLEQTGLVAVSDTRPLCP